MRNFKKEILRFAQDDSRADYRLRGNDSGKNCLTQSEQFVLVIPNIRSGHNVGAMFRTADGAGVSKIYLCGYSPVPPHPQVDKVSLGAEKWIPFEYYRESRRALQVLKEKGYNIYALEQNKNSTDLFKFKPRFPLALIVGNEKTGVPKSLLKYCAGAVEIPMRGRKNSLNVSVAAGIAMYQISQFLK